MAKLQASWVHGVSVQAQREGYFISKVRKGSAAEFNTQGKEWFHFAIPTPVYVEGKRSSLKKIFVLYETVGTAKITDIHVYDAAAKFDIDDLENLSLTGAHSSKLDPYNSWDIKSAPEMKFGLGISIWVDFGASTPGCVPGIKFAAAGADFETP